MTLFHWYKLSALHSQGCGRRRRSQSCISDGIQQLTLEQKLYVAQRELAETQQDHGKLKQGYKRIQDNYKVRAFNTNKYILAVISTHFSCLSFQATLKEAELRLAEIRKAKKEFERRLLKPMTDNRLDMKEPEKVLHYIKDKFKVEIWFGPMITTCTKGYLNRF